MSRSSGWIRRERREAIFERDGHECVYCRAPDDNIARPHGPDHLRPRSKGGGNEATNLVTACHRCNSSKRGLTLSEYVTDVDERRRIRRQAKRRIVAILKRQRFERAVWVEVSRRLAATEETPF